MLTTDGLSELAATTKDFEVVLTKRAGKGLGLSLVGRREGPGVFVADMVRRWEGLKGPKRHNKPDFFFNFTNKCKQREKQNKSEIYLACSI